MNTSRFTKKNLLEVYQFASQFYMRIDTDVKGT